MAIVTQDPAPAIRLNGSPGRWVLVATVLGSSMAFLDATVVNVALPTIGRNLGASLGGLQWTVTAYTLTLAGLILLGDRGRLRRLRRPPRESRRHALRGVAGSPGEAAGLQAADGLELPLGVVVRQRLQL